MSLPFIDLKAQYAALKTTIDARIQRAGPRPVHHGHEVRELETRAGRLRRLAGSTVITVASGTEALLIALMALDLKPGDEVITHAVHRSRRSRPSCWATCLVDIEPGQLQPRRVLDRGGHHAAHAGDHAGQPLRPGLRHGRDQPGRGETRNIPVIEDAAQSFGASYRRRRAAA